MADFATPLDRFTAQFGDNALLYTLLAQLGQDVLLCDAEACIVYCGAQLAALLESAPDDLCGQDWSAMQTAPPRATDADAMAFSGQYLTKAGHLITLVGTCVPLATPQGAAAGQLFVLRSATFRDEAHALVMEESNHRVRNNLAMICALLDMEMMHAPDAERQRLLISLARTRSLALVHNLVQNASSQVEVSVLTRAVMDSARTLFCRIDTPVSVTCPTPAFLNTKRATYLGLALTEIIVHLIRCGITHGTPAFPDIAIARTADTMQLTVTGTVCSATHECDCLLAPLSREILVGLVERSLGGNVTLVERPPFCAVISCPLHDAVTSRCE